MNWKAGARLIKKSWVELQTNKCRKICLDVPTSMKLYMASSIFTLHEYDESNSSACVSYYFMYNGYGKCWSLLKRGKKNPNSKLLAWPKLDQGVFGFETFVPQITVFPKPTQCKLSECFLFFSHCRVYLDMKFTGNLW